MDKAPVRSDRIRLSPTEGKMTFLRSICFAGVGVLIMSTPGTAEIICKAKDYSDCPDRHQPWFGDNYSDTDAANAACSPGRAVSYQLLRTVGSAETINVTCDENGVKPILICFGSQDQCTQGWAWQHKASWLGTNPPSDAQIESDACVPNSVTKVENIPMNGAYRYLKIYCDDKYYRVPFYIGDRDKHPDIYRAGCGAMGHEHEIAAQLCGGADKLHMLDDSIRPDRGDYCGYKVYNAICNAH